MTHQDTIVTASESFTYSSGRDTNLKGAQVIANTIRGTANRNLNIESQQDTDDYQERNRTSGAQLSLCIPPFCYGATVSASVQDSKGNVDSQYASVNRQSGFYAGSGGYDIDTKGNTNLKGGVIASTAEEVKNRLKTQTLTTSDIENRASYSAKNSNVAVSVSVGSSGPGGIDWGGGTSPIQNATNNATSMAAANLQKPQTGTATGSTKSAISPGTITITDDAAQQKLTGKTAAETVASLNRDTANANQTVKPIFDKQKIERQQEIDRVMAEVAQQAAPILYQKVGDMLYNQPEAVKVAIHGLIGGLMSKAMGGEFGSGAAGVAAATAAVATLDGQLGSLGLSQTDRNALLQTIGISVAYAVSGGSASSATTASLADQFNRQLHTRERMWTKESAQDFARFYKEATGESITAEQAERKLAATGYRMVDATASRGIGGDPVAAAYISQYAGDLFHATPAEYNNPLLYGNANGTLTPEQSALPGSVANPAVGLGLAAGLASGGVFSAAAPRLIALGQSAVQFGAEAWTAYRAATAAYSMGAAFGAGAGMSATTYTGGALLGAFFDARRGSDFQNSFGERFSYQGLSAAMAVGGVMGMYGTAMYGWAGIPNSIRNALTVPGAVIRANSAAMGNMAGRAAQGAVNQSNNNR